MVLGKSPVVSVAELGLNAAEGVPETLTLATLAALILDMMLEGNKVAVGETAAWLETVETNWQLEEGAAE